MQGRFWIATKCQQTLSKKTCQQEEDCKFPWPKASGRGDQKSLSAGREFHFFFKKSILFLLTNPKFDFGFVSALISADFEKIFLLSLLFNNLNKKTCQNRQKWTCWQTKNLILALSAGRESIFSKKKCNSLPADKLFWPPRSVVLSKKNVGFLVLTDFFVGRPWRSCCAHRWPFFAIFSKNAEKLRHRELVI